MPSALSSLPVVLLFPARRRAAAIPAGRGAVSLLHPDFEREAIAWPILWAKRHRWRRDLARGFRDEPDSVLADFGLTRRALADYLARPCWRP